MQFCSVVVSNGSSPSTDPRVHQPPSSCFSATRTSTNCYTPSYHSSILESTSASTAVPAASSAITRKCHLLIFITFPLQWKYSHVRSCCFLELKTLITESLVSFWQEEELHLLSAGREQRTNAGHQQYIPPAAPTVPQHHGSHGAHHAHPVHHPHSQAAAAAAAAAALNSTPPVLLQEPGVHPNPHDLYVSTEHLILFPNEETKQKTYQ